MPLEPLDFCWIQHDSTAGATAGKFQNDFFQKPPNTNSQNLLENNRGRRHQTGGSKN